MKEERGGDKKMNKGEGGAGKNKGKKKERV